MRNKMLFNGIFFCLHKAKTAVKAKKGQKNFFAKILRIVQFGEKSNKNFFVGLAFKAKTILAQGSKGLFYDENPFLSIKDSLYSNIRHTSFLNFFILYSTVTSCHKVCHISKILCLSHKTNIVHTSFRVVLFTHKLNSD